MATYTKECYAQNLCDFQDVALYALKYLKNHKISGYTHIIIDEVGFIQSSAAMSYANV